MKLGLVLSGGGFRGVAHAGAIKALEEHGLFPTHIAGTSAGAVVGALYAYGHNDKQIKTFFKKLQIFDIKKFALSKPGFFDAEKFYPFFNSYLINDDFKALNKELIITATNILEGKLETFRKGELIRPLLASSAFPGLFTPVHIDGHYYVDGGALNNFPANLLRPTCDVLIGVYVNGFDIIDMNDLKHSYNVIERAFRLKAIREDLAKFRYCDLVIYPKDLRKFGTFDKRNLDSIFKIGYECASETLANFQMPEINLDKPRDRALKPLENN
jgi:NTE family protein